MVATSEGGIDLVGESGLRNRRRQVTEHHLGPIQRVLHFTVHKNPPRNTKTLEKFWKKKKFENLRSVWFELVGETEKNPRLDYIFSAKRKKMEVEFCALILNFTPNRHEREKQRERLVKNGRKGAIMKYIYGSRKRNESVWTSLYLCVYFYVFRRVEKIY